MKIVRTSTVVVLALVLIVVTVLLQSVGSKSARIATRWSCACVYVEGRELAECMDALQLPVQPIVRVTQDDATQQIHARALLFFSSTARRVPEQSCVVER
ncbi:MAG: hypothetical protein AAFR65_08535 [Pseudomonadota bacterium]